MNKNIVANLSPILAIKGYYILECLENNWKTERDIPEFKFARSLTTSIEGWNDEYMLSWVNESHNELQLYLVIIKIKKSNKYVVFVVTQKQNYKVYISNLSESKPTKKNELTVVVKSDIINTLDNKDIYLYPHNIVYNTKGSDFKNNIVSGYYFNILDSEGWIDASTLTQDQYEIRDLSIAKKCIFPPTGSNNVYGLILHNSDITPNITVLKFLTKNRLIGMEYRFQEVTF